MSSPPSGISYCLITIRGGDPTQMKERPGGTGGQPVLWRIVAVGWPGPFAAVVLFARSSVEEVTAHPPPGSPQMLGAASGHQRREENLLS